MRTVLFPAFLLSLIICSGCHPEVKPEKPDFLAADLDTTVSPSQNFFAYANGGWIKKNPIPTDESEWGVGQLVQEDIYSRLRKINEDAEKEQAPAGSITQKIGDFWYSAMDTVSIEKQKFIPLQADLDRIKAIQTREDLMKLTADFHTIGVKVLFNDGVAQDDKASDLMAYQLAQGGLGMPNRDYYFNTDARTVGIRNAYQNYLFRVLHELDADSAAARSAARAVFALETRLAKASRKLADLRDPYKNYHKMSVSGLEKLSAPFNWPLYLKTAGINGLDSAIVGQPEFYSTLGKELQKTSLDDWKHYLQFHLVQTFTPCLDSVTFRYGFTYLQTLTGAGTPRPRWKRALDREENALGEALGQLFVKEYFNEKTKTRYQALVEAIREAYSERIKKLSWMSDSTKQRALEKLAAIRPKVGYPDKWKDFSAMKIDRGPYALNVERANTWWWNYQIGKLGKPVDRMEWDMSPQTYNAYYNPSNNEIVLPAGIFVVPGMRDEDLDDAFVYGYAAASTIGHEITHGFDDQGRQYDKMGNLKSWWQPADSVRFTERAKKIIRQFNEFNPVDTLHTNGDATQGENIADLGGVLLGLDAFKKTAAYKKNEKIGGLTALQRYFLGYAYGWLYQTRKETLARQVMTDVHAPPEERVNGPVVNIPEFYQAFDVKPGTPMYRPDSLRVNIW
ncbi:MAG: M13 family metallopeptidase [Bacteroidota bacterium]|nr:M13 family metallopeptidase [Bacteroidota bacterium]